MNQLCSLRCASILSTARALRKAGIARCDVISMFVDRFSIVVRCDNVDAFRLSHHDRIDVVLGENDRLIPAVATLFGGMVGAKTASLSVSHERRCTTTIIDMFEDERHRYVNRNGLHLAISICDVAGFGRSDVVLHDAGDVAIAFRSSNTPGSLVVASYIEPDFEENRKLNADIYRQAANLRVAIERVAGNVIANHADFRRLALERCPSFVDIGIVEHLVFRDMGATIYALLPGSNIVDVIEATNVRIVPPVVAVNIDGDEGWAYSAGLGANRSSDDIAIALMPRDADRWRIPGETPTVTATSARQTIANGMRCIVAEAPSLPIIELCNGRIARLDSAPLQSIGACALVDSNACVLFAPSIDDARRASPECIERAVALALAQSPADIGAALHGYATSIDVDCIVDAFRGAIV